MSQLQPPEDPPGTLGKGLPLGPRGGGGAYEWGTTVPKSCYTLSPARTYPTETKDRNNPLPPATKSEPFGVKRGFDLKGV